ALPPEAEYELRSFRASPRELPASGGALWNLASGQVPQRGVPPARNAVRWWVVGSAVRVICFWGLTARRNSIPFALFQEFSEFPETGQEL
ncbi:hypothetical protein ACFC01_47015, partial [Streptomyces mirabilis]|uniref:hypothetical protein n=1 Tax=Streptomyces mirabilis TaxID=68239 RepID=UPI0035D96E1B